MSKIYGFVRDSLTNFSEEMSMVYSPFTLGVFILTIVSLKIYQMLRLNKKLPPGPTGYPLVGMLPFIERDFHLELFDFSKSFGKIFSMKMGNQLIVVLSDHKLIKAAFGKSDYSFRPKTEFGNILGGYGKFKTHTNETFAKAGLTLGIINAEGQLWKNNRRFLHQQKFGMKHLGMGSEIMESRVMQEVYYLLNSIIDKKTNPLNPAPIINCAISNVICSIIMSTRFHHDDEKFKRFMHLFDEGFRLFQLTGAMVFIPALKHLPGTSKALKTLKENRDEMLEFVRFIVNEHKVNLDSENPKDLVDSYLIEMESAKKAGNLDQVFDKDPERQLEQIILDLFSAGVETLKTTLQWAILFMIHNPEVQKRVQEEIGSVVDGDRLPCMDDMTQLPYTRATIYEVMRRVTVVPMGTTHATERTVELEGHIIPKDTHVIPLLHGVHMDPDVWEDPEKFSPERFLTEEGKLYKPKHFMPFGAGQRMCLGDKIAEMELQLFFTSLMHVFDIENPGTDLPSLQGYTGVTVSPKDFEVNFIPRNADALNASNSHQRVQACQHVKLFGSSKESLVIGA